MGKLKLWLKIFVLGVVVATAAGVIVLLATTVGPLQTWFVSDSRGYGLEEWLDAQSSDTFPRMAAGDLAEPNAGIEALFELAMRSSPGGRELIERLVHHTHPDVTSDTDGDGRPEFCDAWGMPFVYIHHTNYGADVSVEPEHGESLRVQAQVDYAGDIRNPKTFQIFSLGFGFDGAELWPKR